MIKNKNLRVRFLCASTFLSVLNHLCEEARSVTRPLVRMLHSPTDVFCLVQF